MTEASQVNRKIRDALAPYGVLQRIESGVTVKGIPDWDYVLLTVPGKLESKIFPTNGECPRTFTIDQLRWGESWERAGGLWHLVGVLDTKPSRWRFYTIWQARDWFTGGKPVPILEATGSFPIHSALEILAPRARRLPRMEK